MADFFGKKPAHLSQKELLETNYNRSIANLLLVVAFSTVNVILLVIKSDTYFLFSAFVPYFAADLGMYYSGSYPQEYYYDVADMEFADKTFLIICVAVAIAIILLYAVSWFLAKKKKVGWLIFATALFCIDTAAMFVIAGVNADMIMDIVFHAWVIFSLISGVVNYNKLKKLPDKEALAVDTEITPISENTDDEQENTPILRMADTDVKSRTLLEAEKNGYHIVYRRVKKTNELIVNGRVYDKYEALMEQPHTLLAYIDGHKIEVTYDALSRMYIIFDSEVLVKKMRLV